MTPNKDKQIKPLRDPKGHFIPKNPKTVKLAKAAIKELKGSKIQQGLILANTEKMHPIKTLPLAEQVKKQQIEIEAIKAGMNKTQTEYFNKIMEQSRIMHGMQVDINSHSEKLDRHGNSIDYVDTVSRDYENSRNTIQDKKAIDWLRKMCNKFTATSTGSSIPFPPSREEVTLEARRWTRKLVGINATWVAYAALAVASFASAQVAIVVIPIGFIIACGISFAIWSE